MHYLFLVIIIIFLLFLGSFILPKQGPIGFGTAGFGRSKHLRWWHKGFVFTKKRLSRTMSYQHTIVCAPTGSGKTQFILAKNAFILPKHYSCIITDPKLELHSISSGYVKEVLKANTYVFNLSHPEQSIGWNPFADIEPKDMQGLMTDMYDIVSEKESESIWKFGAIDILTTTAKALYYYDNGSYLNIANILYVLNHLQVSASNVCHWFASHIHDPETVLAFDRYIASEEKIRHGMLSGAIAAIVPYCSDSVMRISSAHTLPPITEFRKERSVLYLALPIAEDKSFVPFVTLFLSRFFGDLMKTELKANHLPLACLLEEFGNLQKISSYPQLVASIREKKVMLMHCLQNLDQLAYIYGNQAAEIIANNCSSWLLLPGIKSRKTLNYVTESLLGTATIQESIFDNKPAKSFARPLLTNDEVRRLKSGTGLFISDNEQAQRLRLYPLYKTLWLKWKYGLKSKNKKLVSKYAPVSHSVVPNSIEYISLASPKDKDMDQIQFERLLNKHFPNS